MIYIYTEYKYAYIYIYITIVLDAEIISVSSRCGLLSLTGLAISKRGSPKSEYFFPFLGLGHVVF